MIKWFKVYFISSTYAQDISNQSCITNRETPCSWRAFVHGGILQTQPHLLIRNRNGTNPITSFTAALFAHVFSDSDKYPPRTPDGNGGPKRRNMPFEIYRTDIIIGQNWRRSILNISHWVLAKVGNTTDYVKSLTWVDWSRLESSVDSPNLSRLTYFCQP